MTLNPRIVIQIDTGEQICAVIYIGV